MAETPEERAKRIGGIFCIHESPDKEGLTAGLCADCLAAEIRSAVAEAREDERGMVFDAVLEAMISVLKIESPFDQQRLRDEIRKGLRALAGEEEK